MYRATLSALVITAGALSIAAPCQAEIITLAKASATVLQDARSAQESVCRDNGTCLNPRAPSPVCLPLGSGERAWVCQGSILTRSHDKTVKCAVDTFATSTGSRSEYRYTCGI